MLSDFSFGYSNIVLTDDFNMNLCTSSSSSRFVRNAIHDCSCFLVPSEHTHHTVWREQFTHTWLDIFASREESTLVDYTKSDAPFIAGHDLISVHLNFAAPSSPSCSYNTLYSATSSYQPRSSELSYYQLCSKFFSAGSYFYASSTYLF